MYRPIVIDKATGFFMVAKSPIRVGEATQPYHAVTLAQVKRMLQSLGTLTGAPFVSSSMGRLSDSAIGMVWSEAGIHELLDFVYKGQVSSSLGRLSDAAIMPLAVYVVSDSMTIADDTTGFTLSDATPNETLDYVYTGKFVEDVTVTTEGIIPSVVPAVEPVAFLDLPAPYTLSDAMGDETLDYVYTGAGYEPVNVSDVFFTPDLVVATDTLEITGTTDGDLVYSNMTITTDEYPSNGLVFQKTKPNPMGETNSMGDRAWGFVEPKPTEPEP
ncbi:MAG: hypothetical protein LBP87_03260 [Planctomycetaceae bacterium]|jgi:hypothetical protein|nr:hypothetical protein [Planctomycetaceae bacterium]